MLLTNLKQFGEFEVVLLFSQRRDDPAQDDTVPHYLANKYGAQCFVYRDGRLDKDYIPSIRPYLLWQHFEANPELEHEKYFYIDSDVIFREMIDLKSIPLTPNQWFGSDCSGYIAYDYIMSCKRGGEIAIKMAEICGITTQQMRGVPGIGAHILMENPTAAFWERAYHDSNLLHHYFEPIDTDLQKWTAEMWAQLWGMVREGRNPSTLPEMDFCMATDSVERWDEVKIMHNAGVTGSETMFFKGQYTQHTPFGENFDYVDVNKVSRKYVDAIEKVIL